VRGDVQLVFKRLKQHYHAMKVIELDGLTMEFKDWWFNIRASNTEPLVRLNVEAKTELLLKQRTNELLKEIRRR
jgi:phosphomannomutase